MVKGIGIDIVEITRMKKAIDKNSRVVKRILTENEYIHYTTLSTERRKLEYVAGRFAAKEAYAKAAGTGLGKLSLQHIEILSNECGAPEMFVQGASHDIFLSISHSEHYAVAQVVLT
ncbi:holo-ACP synthase [Pseudogracilibacillus sp. ICA-222130]|uniref:holo-ACP synthase n=1 Tax=Pseudogracilibacillus sp. ICA-222130 TaxID=3134655 RepID=UPI0030BDEF80